MKAHLNSSRGPTVALFSIITGLALGTTGFAGTGQSGCGGCCSTSVAAVSTNQDYPLTTCVVSGEALGSMGAPIDYVHKEEGKSDRLVRFCCKSCIKDFKKDPAKYLKMIDDAATAKTTNTHASHAM